MTNNKRPHTHKKKGTDPLSSPLPSAVKSTAGLIRIFNIYVIKLNISPSKYVHSYNFVLFFFFIEFVVSRPSTTRDALCIYYFLPDVKNKTENIVVTNLGEGDNNRRVNIGLARDFSISTAQNARTNPHGTAFAVF